MVKMGIWKSIKKVMTFNNLRDKGLLEYDLQPTKEYSVTNTQDEPTTQDMGDLIVNLNLKIDSDGIKKEILNTEIQRLSRIQSKTKNRRIKNKIDKRIEKLIGEASSCDYYIGVDLAKTSDKTSYFQVK
mgnify:CR=1 FL=1|jgi:hypothetical protein